MPDDIQTIADLTQDPENARRHTPSNLAAIESALGEVGAARSIVIDERGVILAGNATVRAAAEVGIERVQVIDADGQTIIAVRRSNLTDDEKRRLALWDNRAGELAEWEPERLAALVAQNPEITTGIFTSDHLTALLATLPSPPSDDPPAPPPARATLADRFIIPPFSVLDARQGYWQERKRAWLAYGIQSELGRGEALTYADDDVVGHPTLNHGSDSESSARDRGLLGESEQTEQYRHRTGDYGRDRASPGGSPRPAAKLGPDGTTERGDGAGRSLGAMRLDAADGGLSNQMADGKGTRRADARTFGQDLMRGEHVVGQTADQADQSRPTGARFRARPPHGPRVTQNPDGTLNYQPSNAPKPTGIPDGLAHEAPAHPYDESGPGGTVSQSGTSIFDPVLCELAYRWFCPPGGHILDPFAGGSVRGLIASLLGRAYTGIDLSAPQIAANLAQAAVITPTAPPTWIVGDSRQVVPTLTGPFDLVFTCPPYADLERYSDDPRDISTMAYSDFLAALREIISSAVALLADDRFACIVIGDVRDRKGLYHNLVSDTIAAFHDAGAALYNEAILVTAAGSLPIRVGRQFSASRKLDKTHQQVLVFIKGDPIKAVAACGPVEVIDPASLFGEVTHGDDPALADTDAPGPDPDPV